MEKACVYFEEKTGMNSLLRHQRMKRVLREKLLGKSASQVSLFMGWGSQYSSFIL